MRGGAGARPRLMPGFSRGRARAKPFKLNSSPRHDDAGSAELPAQRHHLAATAVLTSILVPSTVPVTVAFLPACWSSTASTALSLVFRT